MAGVIPRLVNAVNRSTEPLDAMFDGQPVVLLPGYAKVEKDGKTIIVGAGPGEAVVSTPLPYFAAEMVKRQNPVMGTEDPESPGDFESLIGIIEWGDDISHIEQSDAEERLDRSLLDDVAQKAKTVRKRSKKRGRGGRRYSDARLKNPNAIKGEYAD